MANCIEEEMAKVMQIGMRVVRGRDWSSGSLDGYGVGTITDSTLINISNSTVLWNVKWDNGFHGCFKMGLNGKYELKILDFKPQAARPTLGSVIFKAKKFTDFKIICGGKTFECHKVILGCQSDVFEAMFTNMNLTEANSGEVTIDDIDPNAMETMLDFLYHEEIKNANLINTKLLFAADKYNIGKLVETCIQHLKSNISEENALDILLTADLTNKTDLLEAASKFCLKNQEKLVKIKSWNDMEKINPKFILELISKVYFR